MANKSEVTIYDGSQDWSSGVDSVKLPSIASTDNPNGLLRSELAWLSNGTVRDGGISQRPTWQPLLKLFGAEGLWQGGAMYEPDNANPYLMFSISGKIYRCDVDGSSPVLLSTTAALSNPPLEPYAFFCQGEQFMVIQAGDNVTLPLFWDGTTLRRSTGLARTLGTTSANFTSPAINHAVFITFAAPGFQGTPNQIFLIDGDTGKEYVRVAVNQLLQITNIGSAGTVGQVIKAGTPILNPAGVQVTRLLVPFTIPALADIGTVNNNAWVAIPYPGSVGDNITIGGQPFNITDLTAPNPGAGQIRAVNINDPAGTVYVAPHVATSIQEITAASPMDYYQGRLWYAIGRQFLAGDIVRGPSGSAFYDFRDSILKVTENPLVLAGDGFTVPDNAGNIRSLFHNANINTTLGQGNLYIGTRKAIYSLEVPVTRTDWIAADSNNAPKQTVVQINNGTVNDRSVTKVNGDVFYATLEPALASLFTQVRNYSQWGAISLSNNENRILQFNDRALLKFASGIYFDNRMLQTALPVQKPQGVVHSALIPLDFVPLSQFGAAEVPNWEGSWSGLDILQMFTGDFGGRERAFAVIVSRVDSTINLWELSVAGRFEDGDKRIEFFSEFPAFTGGDIFELKELLCAEIWVDRLYGTVDFEMDYRPDADSCYHLWHKWQLCSSRNSAEDSENPISYPLTQFCEGYRQTITLPKPQLKCQAQSGRPMNQGYQFQPRLRMKGFCRIRGLRLYMAPRERQLYENLVQPVPRQATI